MNNNYKSEEIDIQIFKDDLLRISIESIAIFTQSSRVLSISDYLNTIGGMFKDEKNKGNCSKKFAFVVGSCAHFEVLKFTT
jgi:hypothetical protein